jgi:hypothetical protein
VPFYQRQINGINAGSSKSSFSALLANKDIVSCILNSNAVCTSPSSVLSNSVIMSFPSLPAAAIKSKGRLCAGIDTLFVSSANVPASIAWYQRERLDTVITENNHLNPNRIDTIYRPSVNGIYKAIVTDTFGCLDTTNSVTVDPLIKPFISINADKTNTCRGDSVQFSATSANTGITPVYQWQINGNQVGVNQSYYASSSSLREILLAVSFMGIHLVALVMIPQTKLFPYKAITTV